MKPPLRSQLIKCTQMYTPPAQPPGDDLQPELFPAVWLTADPLASIIQTAPMGVGRLQAQRESTGLIVDFYCQIANLIQCALTNHPAQDLFTQLLTRLHPDVIPSWMMQRLIEVITTGQP